MRLQICSLSNKSAIQPAAFLNMTSLTSDLLGQVEKIVELHFVANDG